MFTLLDWLYKHSSLMKTFIERHANLSASMAVGHLKKNNKEGALKLCISSLKYNSNPTSISQKTWYWVLMKYAAQIAVDLDDNAAFSEISQLADTSAPLSANNRDISNIFVQLSRWSFKKDNHQKMIDFVKRAIDADSSWGYPRFLFGWYGLFNSGIDFNQYFREAVELDPSIRNEILKDEFCIRNKEHLPEFFN